MLGGRPDGAVEIELLRRPVAGPAAQALERDLDVAGADLDAVVEVAKLAPVPDLDRAAVAAFVLADPHTLGVVAIGAEGRGAGGADPFRPALVAPLLFGESLFQRFHELVETAERLDFGHLLAAEVFLGELPQPVGGEVDRLQNLVDRDGLEPLEGGGEGLVEAVDIALVLHHRGAGEVVEPLDVIGHEPGAHALEKGEVFAQGDRHAMGAELGEEGQEHGRGWLQRGSVRRAVPQRQGPRDGVRVRLRAGRGGGNPRRTRQRRRGGHRVRNTVMNSPMMPKASA